MAITTGFAELDRIINPTAPGLPTGLISEVYGADAAALNAVAAAIVNRGAVAFDCRDWPAESVARRASDAVHAGQSVIIEHVEAWRATSSIEHDGPGDAPDVLPTDWCYASERTLSRFLRALSPLATRTGAAAVFTRYEVARRPYTTDAAAAVLVRPLRFYASVRVELRPLGKHSVRAFVSKNKLVAPHETLDLLYVS